MSSLGCVLAIGRMPLTAPTDFYIGGHALSFVSSCRDLGVTVSHDSKPTTRIKQIVTKVHQRANAILRSFVSRDTDLLLRAFTVYVLLLLEYNSIVLSPKVSKIIIIIIFFNNKLTSATSTQYRQ